MTEFGSFSSSFCDVDDSSLSDDEIDAVGNRSRLFSLIKLVLNGDEDDVIEDALDEIPRLLGLVEVDHSDLKLASVLINLCLGEFFEFPDQCCSILNQTVYAFAQTQILSTRALFNALKPLMNVKYNKTFFTVIAKLPLLNEWNRADYERDWTAMFRYFFLKIKESILGIEHDLSKFSHERIKHWFMTMCHFLANPAEHSVPSTALNDLSSFLLDRLTTTTDQSSIASALTRKYSAILLAVVVKASSPNPLLPRIDQIRQIIRQFRSIDGHKCEISHLAVLKLIEVLIKQNFPCFDPDLLEFALRNDDELPIELISAMVDFHPLNIPERLHRPIHDLAFKLAFEGNDDLAKIVVFGEPFPAREYRPELIFAQNRLMRNLAKYNEWTKNGIRPGGFHFGFEQSPILPILVRENEENPDDVECIVVSSSSSSDAEQIASHENNSLVEVVVPKQITDNEDDQDFCGSKSKRLKFGDSDEDFGSRCSNDSFEIIVRSFKG